MYQPQLLLKIQRKTFKNENTKTLKSELANRYETTLEELEQNLNFRENYERKFKQYENLEKPITTSKKIEVAIYPNKRSYSVKANYILKNKSENSTYNKREQKQVDKI